MSDLQRLGRYEIRAVIGRGAMGVVYEAWDSFLERRVAVKTYQRDVARGDALRRRFLKEVKVASKLSHPNIVIVYDGGIEDDVPFLAMELVDGHSLQRAMTEGQRSPRETVVALLRPIASALAYAHSCGVVHRDLKPANILVDRKGQPKIVDFGVAKVIGSQTQATASIVGTPTHMAPEQIEGGEVDGRADVFALAVIAYELVTGARAFQGATATNIIYNVMYLEPAPPSEVVPDLSPAVDEVFRRALCKRPADRTPDPVTFVRELEEALAAPRPASRPRVAAPERPPGPKPAVDVAPTLVVEEGPVVTTRARPRLAPILGAVAAIGGLALAGLGFLRETPRPPGPETSMTSTAPAASPSAASPPAAPPSEAISPTALQTEKPPLVEAVAAPEAIEPAVVAPPEIPPAVPAAVPAKPAETAEAASSEAASPRKKIPPERDTPTREARLRSVEPDPGKPDAIDGSVAMKISSEPAGARVWIDGVDRGSTPLRLTGIAAGRHELELFADDHVPYRETVELDGKATKEVTASLEPLRTGGSLTILSEPPGLSVRLNGAVRGTTPLSLDGLEPGPYDVAVDFPGVPTGSRQVEIHENEIRELRFSLGD